jgi:hypothetical protein
LTDEREHEPPRRRLRRLRREREALFSDLGALVYELHRRGERSPELLQERAAALGELDREVRSLEETLRPGQDDGSSSPSEPPPNRCEACGRSLEAGQLVCLSCGARPAAPRPTLQERLPKAESLPGLALLLALVVLVCGAVGYLLAGALDGGDEPGPPPPRAEAPGSPQATAPPVATPAPTAEEPVEAGAGEPQRPRTSLLQRWPAGQSAHTVVLVTSSDRPAVLNVARQAARSGLEAGIVDAGRFDLGSGLWIVFSGRYESREKAAVDAVRLRERYPGAYPQLLAARG